MTGHNDALLGLRCYLKIIICQEINMGTKGPFTSCMTPIKITLTMHDAEGMNDSAQSRVMADWRSAFSLSTFLCSLMATRGQISE